MSNKDRIDKIKFNCKLQTVLIERGISQTELSCMVGRLFKVGIGKDAINRIVTGKKQNYHLFTLLKICYALDITPNDLIEKEQFLNEFIDVQNIDI